MCVDHLIEGTLTYEKRKTMNTATQMITGKSFLFGTEYTFMIISQVA